MASLPDYVIYQLAGYSESFDPSVERTEMERGVPKERRINSRVLMKVNATFIFKSLADANAFEDWYFDTIKRIGWFTVTNPRVGMKSMRFEGGNIGDLIPLAPDFSTCVRQVVMEYLR